MAKNDSAIALSQQIPVNPIDRVMPFSVANLVIWAEALGPPVGVEHDLRGQLPRAG